jgi:hypothetical protein
LEEEPDEIWLEGQKETISNRSNLSILTEIIQSLKEAFATAKSFAIESAIPYLKKLFGMAGSKIQRKKEIRSGSIIAETTESLFRDNTEDNLPRSSYKSEIRIKESDEFPRLAGSRRKAEGIRKSIGIFMGKVYGFFAKQSRRKRPTFLGKISKKYFGYAAILIIIILIPFIFINKNNQSKEEDRKTEETKIEQLNASLEETLASSDEQKVISSLQELSKQYEELANSQYVLDQAKAKIADISTKINQLSNTVSTSLSNISDLSGTAKADLVGIYKIEGNLYSLSSDGSAYVTGTDGNSSQLQTSGELTGNIIASTALTKIRTIEVLTDTPAVFEFDIDTNTFTAKEASDGWEPAIDIDSFGTISTCYLPMGRYTSIFEPREDMAKEANTSMEI